MAGRRTLTQGRLLAVAGIAAVAVIAGIVAFLVIRQDRPAQTAAPAPQTAQAPPPAAASPAPGAPPGAPAPPAPAPGGPIRYIALGDSVSQGAGSNDLTHAFPILLADIWRSQGCPVELQNLGTSGYPAGQILADQVPQIEAFRPTLITFQAGAIDIVDGTSLDQYRQNVGAVLDAAKSSGARVIVLAQYEWFRSPQGPSYGTDLAAKRDSYDAVLIEQAQSHGAQFVDLRPLYRQQADQGLWAPDGVHPTAAAYEAWANQIATAVPCK